MSNTLVVDMNEFCQVVGMPVAFVIEIVEHCIVEPHGQKPDEWVFDTYSLSIAKPAAKLHHDLEPEWDGVALALNLLDELEQARAENRMLKQRLGRFLE